VYLTMTGGQTALLLGSSDQGADGSEEGDSAIRRLPSERPALRVISASDAELENHKTKLEQIQKQSGNCLWLAGE
nr:DNA polymerase III subunit epsilon [Endozoicomonas sp.]